MARAPSFKTSALRELLRQLRFAPAERRRHQMDAAEALVADVDPGLAYPEDFIIWRTTGYRPDAGGEPVLLPGEAVLADLCCFVQELSSDLELPPMRDEAAAIPLEDVAVRLNVSTKTVQRYRRQGLVCHHVRFDAERRLLACYEDALERFTSAKRDQVARAGRFSRLGGAGEEAIIDAARAMHATEGTSLNETALRLAGRFNRAHETMRGLLKRHDRRSRDPIFTEHGPLDDRDKHLLVRAACFGVSLKALAERFGRSRDSIERVIAVERGRLLAKWPLPAVDLPTFALEDAEEIVLAPAVVQTGLDPGPWPEEALAVLAEARRLAAETEAPERDNDEDALAAALHFLSRRAGERVRSLSDRPGLHELDAIETDLRWIAAIRHRLIMRALPTAALRIEHHLGRALADRSPEVIRTLLPLAVRESLAAIVSLDPSRGQRLDRRVAMEMDRALVRERIARSADRAGVRHREGGVPVPGLFRDLAPWRSAIGPRADLRAFVTLLSAEERAVVETRWGWGSERPRTIMETASLRGMTTRAARAGETNALAILRRAARGG